MDHDVAWLSTLAQDAEFVGSGVKSHQFWQMIPVAGVKRLVQSPPPFVRFWKRAGCRARQVSGRRQTPVLPSTSLCAMWRRLSAVSPETWRSNCGSKRLGTRSAMAWSKVSQPILPRKPGISWSERNMHVHGCAGAGFSGLWSYQQTSHAYGWLDSRSVVLCSLRPKDPCHQKARIVGMP